MQSTHLCTINHNDKVVQCSKKGNINRTELKPTEKNARNCRIFLSEKNILINTKLQEAHGTSVYHQDSVP